MRKQPLTLQENLSPPGETGDDPFQDTEKVGLLFFTLLTKLQPYERQV
jgi:hypothetical protein